MAFLRTLCRANMHFTFIPFLFHCCFRIFLLFKIVLFLLWSSLVGTGIIFLISDFWCTLAFALTVFFSRLFELSIIFFKCLTTSTLTLFLLLLCYFFASSPSCVQNEVILNLWKLCLYIQCVLFQGIFTLKQSFSNCCLNIKQLYIMKHTKYRHRYI